MAEMSRTLGLIGVPTSAGAFAPGQERAPGALRDAGLIEALEEAGATVNDRGDRPVWRWRPDRANRGAQNVGAVVEIVADTTVRVTEAAEAGETTLVLGGDCTVGIGTVAGHVRSGERVGLLYFDAHADLNLPDSVREGTLDWMGMAHMLAEEGAVPELAAVGGQTPLLEPAQVALVGWDPVQSEPGEREAIKRLSLEVVDADELRADPAAAAARALELVDRAERLVIHFDVDVIDFTDTPLSENVGRNVGIAYELAIAALETLTADRRLAGLTLAELNPTHVEEGAGSIERLVGDIARSLAPSR
jgi:arginase